MLLVAVLVTGCDREAERERQRLELERQVQREIKRSNEAVNAVSDKLGRRPPALDLGLKSPPPADPAAPPAAKP